MVKGDNVANHIFLTWELTHPHYAGCPMHLVDDDAIYDPEKLLRFLAEVKCTQVRDQQLSSLGLGKLRLHAMRHSWTVNQFNHPYEQLHLDPCPLLCASSQSGLLCVALCVA